MSSILNGEATKKNNNNLNQDLSSITPSSPTNSVYCDSNDTKDAPFQSSMNDYNDYRSTKNSGNDMKKQNNGSCGLS